ncbi:winged helix-turn-helix domain-containing protein [Actinocrispum wychmicini]|uniref:Helix-turn-helix protein n=1 Tax=Actinocrispum wychmicini TaxID=1213861 RepID=A0A4R2KEU4_9PSEU|nr:helix-turn-helix domain-containing protein [Actinocrispum wychmicini]TCO65075.1 helix-turn-helix protein [Actinocrispum wychmicini]
MPDDFVDLSTARALANPLRQRILRELGRLGEATSTTLADRLGVTTGGTSYNLRVLAEHGLVEEAPELAKGKERWWRPARKSLRFPPRGEQEPQLRAELERLNQLWLTEDMATFGEFLDSRETLGPWGDALPYSRGAIRVSLDELAEFFDAYLDLLKRFQRPDEDTPAGARTVLTRFIAFPDPKEAGR